MPKVDVLDMKGKKVSDIELADSIFGIEPNEAIVHSVLVNYLANQRDKVHKVQKQEQKFQVVVKNHGDKKEQVEQDKVQSELHNGLKVV